MLGLIFSALGLAAASLTHSVTMFALTLVPLSLGQGLGMPTISSLVSRAAGPREQGRVQGAASAVESLGRTVGPVWGAGSFQRINDSAPYVSAAAFLLITLLLSIGYRVSQADSLAPASESPAI
jgi:DHA1 family tetracycline resistance protein-like MFS transporter